MDVVRGARPGCFARLDPIRFGHNLLWLFRIRLQSTATSRSSLQIWLSQCLHCFYLQHSKRQPPHALCPNTRPPQERVVKTKMSEIHDPNRVWMGDIKCLDPRPRGPVVALWSQLSPKHTPGAIRSSARHDWCRSVGGSTCRILANFLAGLLTHTSTQW